MYTRNDDVRRLHTYADRPVTEPNQDKFGFVPYADAFSLVINDSETATPLTVAISGPWGSGKTSLARLIENRLKVEQYWRLSWRRAPLTSWFNAWMHCDAPNLGSALAASVTRDLGRMRPWYWRLLSPLPSVMLSPEWRAWRKIWFTLVVASIAFLLYLSLLWLVPSLRPESGKLGKVFGHWNLPLIYAAIPAAVAFIRRTCKISDSLANFVDAPRSAAAQGSLREVKDQVGRLIRQAQRRWRSHAQRRVVIFVDDLERCPADKALDMCEVVSQLLGHDDVVTVLVADLDLLEAAADERYKSTRTSNSESKTYSEIGQEYLDKLIQLRFNLPPVDRKAVASALGMAPSPDNRQGQ